MSAVYPSTVVLDAHVSGRGEIEAQVELQDLLESPCYLAAPARKFVATIHCDRGQTVTIRMPDGDTWKIAASEIRIIGDGAAFIGECAKIAASEVFIGECDDHDDHDTDEPVPIVMHYSEPIQ